MRCGYFVVVAYGLILAIIPEWYHSAASQTQPAKGLFEAIFCNGVLVSTAVTLY